MRFRPLVLPFALAAFATLLGVLPAPAQSAQRTPTVTYVAPTRVKAGQILVLRGTAFSSRRRSNTIIFRGAAGRVLLIKPRTSSPRRLSVRVPRAIERLLAAGADGRKRPTRITIRISVRKKFSKFTTSTRSPVVVPLSGAPAPGGTTTPPAGGYPGAPVPQPGAPGGTQACGTGDDFDGDLLSNSFEASIDTDPCKADTDGDTVEDGFEYHSARDLNQDAVPYPGKRPFANPLDPTDANNDYDSDGLSHREEFLAWAHAPADPAALAAPVLHGQPPRARLRRPV